MEDLWATASSPPMMTHADAVWFGGDNGPSYSVNQLLLLQLTWRLARASNWVWLGIGAQTPDHSAWHWHWRLALALGAAILYHSPSRAWACIGSVVVRR